MPVLIFALELVVLYGCGSYTMSRMTAWGFGGSIGKAAFYLLVLPGVILHETAHCLACLLSGTRIKRFVPFWPEKSLEGRLRLGYVRHEGRSAPIASLIGLAPMVLNPVGILIVSVLLTPLTLPEVVDPQPGILVERIFSSEFFVESPDVAAVWAYLTFSFALGSVPSREDLSSVPAAFLLFALGVFALSFFQEGSGDALLLALAELSRWVAGIYALPTGLAAAGALLLGLWDRRLS
jgi:hypothetical protein